MNNKKNILVALAVLGLVMLACNFALPSNIPVPTGLPELPTITLPEFSTPGAPPEGEATQPVPVTGAPDNQVLLFYAFLALLAVIVLLGLFAVMRKSGESKDEGETRR